MTHWINRRELLAQAAVAATAGLTASAAMAAPQQAPQRAEGEPFIYCLNTSTIRGQELPLPEEVDIAARAGYQAIEPWIREIQQYVEQGGSLKDLRKRIADQGLTVESAIGFAEWIVDDDQRRAKGLETAKRDMDLVQQLGGRRIAAPPVGATQQLDLDLFQAAERYGQLLEVGRQMDVVPQVELWGFSTTLSRLGEVMLVALESGHPQACLLPDIYHIYKGGSDFTGLRLIDGQAIQVLHMNDYPADPPRPTIRDADRIYPGDGIAPLKQTLQDLYRAGFRGVLSLELFNPDYWKQDALRVARTGLEKMRDTVQASLAEV